MTTFTSPSKPKIDELLNIYEFKNSSEQVKGFLLKSTAPNNVEDDSDIYIPSDCREYFCEKDLKTETIDTELKKSLNRLPKAIKPITNLLNQNIPTNFLVKPITRRVDRSIDPEKIKKIVKVLATGKNPEIVVRIHGYSTSEEGAIKSYYSMIEDIQSYTKEQEIDKTFIFLGYRWPSEKPTTDNWCQALPILPRLILGFSFFGIIVSIILLLFDLLNKIALIFLSFFVAFLFFAIIVLILLRFTAYFRDTFRATNYGVPDLVELIRTLDNAVIAYNNNLDSTNKKDYTKRENKIELSFIAHSMGSYVTTNTIRILSDVFTNEAIEGNPKSYVGNIFSLARLILVAPDIPVETIMPRRANFLQSSLERFKESYIFSNEGDVVLRIASTAANYFSFPARDRFSGYRLGNITAKRCTKEIKYGIVDDQNPFDYLEVRSSDGKKPLENFLGNTHDSNNLRQRTSLITNKFTYFDCTDYKECVGDKKVTPVSLASQKQALNFFDYAILFIRNLLVPKTWKIDTHGGYFTGYFSRKLIYKLAFLGFDGLLNSYSSETQSNGNNTLSVFSQKCKEKQIQVILSPNRKNKPKKP